MRAGAGIKAAGRWRHAGAPRCSGTSRPARATTAAPEGGGVDPPTRLIELDAPAAVLCLGVDGADLRHEQRRLFLVILGEVRPLLAPRLLAVAGPVPDLAAIAATILVGGTISAILAGALRLPPWLAAPPPPPLRETEEPSPASSRAGALPTTPP